MTRALVVINSEADRNLIASWARQAECGTRVEFKRARRSIPQNSLLWAALTDVSRQVEYHGMRLTPDDWKLIFLDGLNREVRMVPNLDGTGFVNLGRSSSDLSKQEMTDLIELIFEFGARHAVVFNEKEEAA